MVSEATSAIKIVSNSIRNIKNNILYCVPKEPVEIITRLRTYRQGIPCNHPFSDQIFYDGISLTTFRTN